MQVFPNTTSPIIDANGSIKKPWVQYLQQFTQAPPNFNQSSVGNSPFTYTAAEPGYINVSGGTVSSIKLTRGNTTIDVTGNTLDPVALSDTITVEHSVKPTIHFIPTLGANTSS